MKAANRYGTHTPQGAFSHTQQFNLPHRTPQHQASNSSGLPPPSLSNAFASGAANPFAPTGNLNGLAGGFGPSFNGNGTGLASQEAVNRFHDAGQGQNKHMRRNKGGSKSQQDLRIRDVYASNLKEEMDLLEQLVDKYPYISMDTEFPGIVARPMGAFTTKADYHYQCLRCNVDLLKVIQLGITIFDKDGNPPPANFADISDIQILNYSQNLKPCPTTWQFNFKFSLEEDMYNNASIDFLVDIGLDLKKSETDGIDPAKFGSRLITSGLAYFEDVRWISFHSGYDFAYLVKLMNQNELPEDETEYRRLLKIYFPCIYDIKFMIQHALRTQSVNDQPLSPEAVNILNSFNQTKGSLQSLADELHIRRVGTAHFAGSDALITGKVFWEVKSKIFGGQINPEKYIGQIWGLNLSGTPLFSPQSAGGFGPNVEGQANTPNLNGATIYNNGVQNQPQPPSTPASTHTGLASTPSQQRPDTAGAGGGLGTLTPGGGSGAFGSFRFGKG
ncbi:uncharacterized protein KY384_003920 [Bacidia gigantensis]|uniref:uncharacterized protein n=1 Tax=Bacidia gigantensis TaxID=2732470 RepID=UPI001D057723|nr:uncharacterized protein KY384_003920 [Bacidia gigantensis]KAG8532279.1 hypothetical protein KY384_003920 [Bacidia gigantensis]